MNEYIKHLNSQDQEFVYWVKSSDFPYQFILLYKDGLDSFQVYSIDKFRQFVDDIVMDAVNDPDNFTKDDYTQTFPGSYDEPPEYELSEDATISLPVFDLEPNKSFTLNTTYDYGVGFNLSDDIYEVFKKINKRFTDNEIFDYINRLINKFWTQVTPAQQNEVKQYLKQQQDKKLINGTDNITPDDIKDLFDI